MPKMRKLPAFPQVMSSWDPQAKEGRHHAMCNRTGCRSEVLIRMYGFRRDQFEEVLKALGWFIRLQDLLYCPFHAKIQAVREAEEQKESK